MTTRTNFAHWLSLAALALALLAVSSDKEKVRGQALAVAVVQNAWSDEDFEQWVFNYEGDAASARRKFDASLKLAIEEIDRHCRLTDDQRQKLLLMAHGDIKQVFDSFEKAKRQFNLLGNDIQKLNEISPLIQPIRAAHMSLLRDGSLFAKSMRHILTRNSLPVMTWRWASAASSSTGRASS